MLTYHVLDVQATGIGHVMGNKGGVGLGLQLQGFGSLAFVSSHLAAKASHTASRQVGRLWHTTE